MPLEIVRGLVLVLSNATTSFNSKCFFAMHLGINVGNVSVRVRDWKANNINVFSTCSLDYYIKIHPLLNRCLNQCICFNREFCSSRKQKALNRSKPYCQRRRSYKFIKSLNAVWFLKELRHDILSHFFDGLNYGWCAEKPKKEQGWLRMEKIENGLQMTIFKILANFFFQNDKRTMT